MNRDLIIRQYAYNCWAHARVWNVLITLTDQQWTQNVGYAFDSVCGQFVHVYNVDRRWFARIGGYAVPERMPESVFPTPGSLHQAWVDMEAQHQKLLTGFTDADFDAVIEYDIPHRGGLRRNTRGEVVLHVVNHGTDHRAQTLAMLHLLGAPTVEQDLMFYLWEQKSS